MLYTSASSSVAFVSALPTQPSRRQSQLSPATSTTRPWLIQLRHRPRVSTRLPPRCTLNVNANKNEGKGPSPYRDASHSPAQAAQSVDFPLGSPSQPPRFAPHLWFEGLIDDLKRRLPLYASDWTDGLRFKSIPVILFLYFACLAPVIAFGGLTFSLTAGSMGVIEFIISSGITGMIYAAFSAQPLTFIAPTGLTLAFVTALFGFCRLASLPFLPIHAWVGIWTSVILLVAAIINASDTIKYCTRFTDDIFNSLIATNFIYEAAKSLSVPFLLCGANKTSPFMAVTLALGTFLMGRLLTGLRTSRYFVKRVRSLLADFGPVLAIACMSAVAAIPAVAKIGLEKLSIPPNFSLAGGRTLLIPLLGVPMHMRIACIVPAILLTCVFFLDQNISSRVVNSPIHKLKKGPGYHLDLLVLALCTFICSLTGLPWMCAGTVQSLAHVRSLAEVESKNGTEVIVSVQENRLTAFCIHTAVLCSLFLLPIVKRIPMSVVSGLFLFLGFSMFNGNEFLNRIRYIFMDPKMYPEGTPMKTTSPLQVHAFTIMQTVCLVSLWVLKLNKKTSMFFPALIAMLMLVRSRIAPVFFSADALSNLDGELIEMENAVHEERGPDHKLSPAN